MDQVFKGECALSVDTTELSASIWVGMHGRSTETGHSRSINCGLCTRTSFLWKQLLLFDKIPNIINYKYVERMYIF